jgi:uncharacterized membrane protein
MYSRARYDALTDGIFAMAMTLLVLDVRIPDDINGTDPVAIVRAMTGVTGKLAIYALSFTVLGIIWLGRVEAKAKPETVGRREALLGLIMLFLVSMVPFSSIAVSDYASARAAIGVYCADLGLIGVLTALLKLHEARGKFRNADAISSVVLAVSAALAFLATYVTIEHSLWMFALNAFGRPIQTLARRGAGSPDPPANRDVG